MEAVLNKAFIYGHFHSPLSHLPGSSHWVFLLSLEGVTLEFYQVSLVILFL